MALLSRMLKFLSGLLCICAVTGVHADESLIELKCQALVHFRDAQQTQRLSVENFVLSIQSQTAGHVFRVNGDTHIRLHVSTVKPWTATRQRVDVNSNEWKFEVDQSMLTLSILTGKLIYEETQAPHGSRAVSAMGRCTLPLDALSLG